MSSTESTSHLFGFNGKEKLNEAYGEGNCYSYDYRIYDPRTCRMFSMDPFALRHPNISPFAYSANSPIMLRENDGRDWGISITYNSVTGEIDIKLTFKGAFLNTANAEFDQTVLVNNSISQMEKILTTSGYWGYDYSLENVSNLTDHPVMMLVNTKWVKVNVTADVNLRMIENKSELQGDEHLFEILPSDQMRKGVSGDPVQGDAFTTDGKYIAINEDAIPGIVANTDQNLITHEALHTAGLEHPEDTSDPNQQLNGQPNNVMYGGGYRKYGLDSDEPGTDINLNQIDIMRKNIQNGKVNKNNIPEDDAPNPNDRLKMPE